MIVFEDKDSFANSQLVSLTPPASDSFSDSLNSSWEGSISLQIGTPASAATRRTSFDSTGQLDDLSFHNSAPPHNCLPMAYAESPHNNAFCSMSAMTQDMLAGYQSSPSMYLGLDDGKVLADASTSTLNYNNFQPYNSAHFGPFESQCPSSDIPSLMDDLYSPTSTSGTSVTMDFVNPSHTTFMGSFENLQLSPGEPITPVKFGTPYSDTNGQRSFNASPCDSMGYLAPTYPAHLKDEVSHYVSPTRHVPSRQPRQRQQNSALMDYQIQLGKQSRKSRIKREEIPPNVQFAGKAKLPCPHEDCVKRFQRKEHLKRHLETHDPNHPKHECPFCQRPFGRRDNLKSHIRLHAAKKTKAKRTKFAKGADVVWESMGKKTRKAAKSDLPVNPSIPGY